MHKVLLQGALVRFQDVTATGPAAKLFPILVQIYFKLLFSVDWDCMTRAGRNNENEVHLEKPLCNIEFKDYIIESTPDAPSGIVIIFFINSKISSDHDSMHCIGEWRPLRSFILF